MIYCRFGLHIGYQDIIEHIYLYYFNQKVLEL